VFIPFEMPLPLRLLTLQSRGRPVNCSSSRRCTAPKGRNELISGPPTPNWITTRKCIATAFTNAAVVAIRASIQRGKPWG